MQVSLTDLSYIVVNDTLPMTERLAALKLHQDTWAGSDQGDVCEADVDDFVKSFVEWDVIG